MTPFSIILSPGLEPLTHIKLYGTREWKLEYCVVPFREFAQRKKIEASTRHKFYSRMKGSGFSKPLNTLKMS